MVANRRIASTPLDGLKPLGTAGQRSYTLIARAVREALGEEHERLFAEPVPSPAGDVIDWYSGTDAPVVPVNKLGEEQREQILARLGQLVADIEGEATRLEASDDPERKRLGAALRNATEIPDDTHIYACGDQPVVICWSYHQNVRHAPRGVLSAHVKRKPPPRTPTGLAAAVAPGAATMQPAAAAVVAAPWGWAPLAWLLWLLIGIVTAALIYLLTMACGISGLRALDFCPVPVAAGVVVEEDRSAALREELARLQRDLGQADLQCRPAPPVRHAEAVPDVPVPQPEPPRDEFSDRVREQGGATDGKLVITLTWDTTSDLDLAVRCPTGPWITFQRRSGCGGSLDVDANSHSNRIMPRPVENVIFAESAPNGQYTIEINLFRVRNNGAPNPFRVKVSKASGDLFFQGSLTRAKEKRRFTFSYP